MCGAVTKAKLVDPKPWVTRGQGNGMTFNPVFCSPAGLTLGPDPGLLIVSFVLLLKRSVYKWKGYSLQSHRDLDGLHHLGAV